MANSARLLETLQTSYGSIMVCGFTILQDVNEKKSIGALIATTNNNQDKFSLSPKLYEENETISTLMECHFFKSLR